ncbi:MAG: hypothetical protein QXM68_00135 [Candidatus Aenigmatarchaeota archaeon]|nr:hypothetical protein [Candidatus Aenigmarchaeota archaeon]
MTYAVIECNRKDCPKQCPYNILELDLDLLRTSKPSGKVVIGNNGLHCQLGQSVGTVYFFDEKPANPPNLFLYG